MLCEKRDNSSKILYCLRKYGQWEVTPILLDALYMYILYTICIL